MAICQKSGRPKYGWRILKWILNKNGEYMDRINFIIPQIIQWVLTNKEIYASVKKIYSNRDIEVK